MLVRGVKTLKGATTLGTRRRMTQLPDPLPGRPVCVNFEGGKLYISAHDAFHLERLREFKRLIRAAHPDRNHCIWASGRTRNLLNARKRWEEWETRWYARFGLDPPTTSLLRPALPDDEDQRRGAPSMVLAQRVRFTEKKRIEG